jgi:polar amino acid transport system substrate-binding protein
MNFLRSRTLWLGLFGVAAIVVAVMWWLGRSSLSQRAEGPSSLKDIPGHVIGVQLGTTGDVMASRYEGDAAGTDVERYANSADAVQALMQGKVDCMIEDEQPALAFVRQNPGLALLSEEFSRDSYAFCVANGRVELITRIDRALDRLRRAGTLDSIAHQHIHRGKDVAYTRRDVARNNGTLVVATNANYKPYEYFADGKVVGIDIDIMQAVCDELGMTMEVEEMAFESIITAVQTGKVDVGASAFTVTPDRSKNVLFSTPYAVSKQVVIVRGSAPAADNRSLADKFKANFIDADRYLYLFNGLGNTLIITVFAMLISLVLGSCIAIVRTTHDSRGGLTLLNALCRLYLTIIRGTPTMVQLLIIYYVVFASANVSKVFVAVVAFGLNSAAYLAEIVRAGIQSIDKGQMEAGRSLGLSYGKTLQLIILPQAFKNVLPAMGNELIVLLKETSISGYIGLVDLTKGSDIIRSVTYDAMMPLTLVALVYLALVMALSAGVSRLEKSLHKGDRQ